MKLARRATIVAFPALVLGVLSLGYIAAGPAEAAKVPTLRPSLSIQRVDTTAFPHVAIDTLVLGQTGSPHFVVQENGAPVSGLQTQSVVQAGRSVGTVLVIDTAASMNDKGKLTQAKLAARQFVARLQPNESVAVVQAGAVARVVANFSSDAGQLDNSINQLGGQGEMALYDGVNAASALFADHPELLASIVVVADRNDTLSRITLGQAVGAEGAAHAAVFAIGIPGDANFDASALEALATGGGQYLAVQSPTDLTSALGAVQQSLQGTAELRFTSRPTSALDLTVSAGGLEAAAHTVPGAVASGSDVTPTRVTLRTAPGPLKNKAGEALIALLALVAMGLLVYAGLVLIAGPRGTLEGALAPYEGDKERPRDDDAQGSYVQNALITRAMETTTKFARDRGLLDRVETKLDQADLALRPAEAIFFYTIGLVIAVVAAFVIGGPLIGLMALLFVGLVPPALLNYLATRRLKQFVSQLPDTLQLLASSLRAGFSFLQGVEAVAEESDNPMGSELRRVLIEARLGRPIEDALQDCADRMGSADFDWAVMAVGIQREVGGNLAELLQTVSETMIERERLRRDVKSLTAEGRVSAIVLGIMPPALGFLFYVTNPTYIKVLFHNLGGQIALGLAILAAVIGFFWMNGIVDIEV